MTVANLITLIRVVLIPFFLAALLYGDFKTAFFIFLFAGFTDSLDGFIARFFNQKSVLGSVMDPVADKLLLSTAFICLTIPRSGEVYVIPIWVTLLTFSRDFLIVLFVLIQVLFFDTEIKNFMPSFWGKCTTTVQIAFIISVMLRNSYGLNEILVDVLLFGVVGFTLLSGFHYLWRTRNIEAK